ncbi:hypothetical protein GN958_ATG02723, partial [Phytophthora infestans]
SDSENDTALLQALSTPVSHQQEDAKSSTSPAKTKKGSPASSVSSWSDDSTPPVVTCPRLHGVFSSWNALEAAFANYQSDTFQMYKLRTSNSINDPNRIRIKQAAKRGSVT